MENITKKIEEIELLENNSCIHDYLTEYRLLLEEFNKKTNLLAQRLKIEKSNRIRLIEELRKELILLFGHYSEVLVQTKKSDELPEEFNKLLIIKSRLDKYARLSGNLNENKALNSIESIERYIKKIYYGFVCESLGHEYECHPHSDKVKIVNDGVAHYAKCTLCSKLIKYEMNQDKQYNRSLFDNLERKCK